MFGAQRFKEWHNFYLDFAMPTLELLFYDRKSQKKRKFQLEGSPILKISTLNFHNLRNKAILLYLMFGPMKKIMSEAEQNLVAIMWTEPCNALVINEDFKTLSEVLSMLFEDDNLEFETMESLLRELSMGD